MNLQLSEFDREAEAQRWLEERINLSFSDRERDARFARIRKAMNEAGMDALVLCGIGGSWMYEGNIRYVIGDKLRCNPQIDFVVFPAEGEPTLILDYGMKKHLAEKSWTPQVQAPVDPRGKDPRKSDDKRSVGVSEVIKKYGLQGGTIGITRAMMPAVNYEDLKSNLPNANFVECSKLMIDVRSIKSAEEIAFIRRSAVLADEAWGTACEFASEGVFEHQLVAKWQHTVIMGGAERSFDMVASDPVGPFCVGFPGDVKRLAKGDAVVAEISPVFAGYFSQLVRCLSVGPLDPKLAEIVKVCEEAANAGAELLRPGVRAAEVAQKIEGIVTKNGYIPLTRPGHTSVGLDLLEIPLHPEDETVFEPGMAVIIHPNAGVQGYSYGKPSYLGPGDTFVITESGAERLNTSSQDVVFV